MARTLTSWVLKPGPRPVQARQIFPRERLITRGPLTKASRRKVSSSPSCFPNLEEGFLQAFFLGHLEVRQSVRDLEGKPLQGQTHGLKDKTVGHVFRLREGKVARFDIQDAA